jgi:hypothetical protein
MRKMKERNERKKNDLRPFFFSLCVLFNGGERKENNGLIYGRQVKKNVKK